jgi:hypothetical protein
MKTFAACGALPNKTADYDRLRATAWKLMSLGRII